MTVNLGYLFAALACAALVAWGLISGSIGGAWARYKAKREMAAQQAAADKERRRLNDASELAALADLVRRTQEINNAARNAGSNPADSISRATR